MSDLRKLLDEATPGPWVMETVKTSCGTCHKIGPFPRPNYASKKEGWACVYDDYPPGIGSKDLLANARLIAIAPDLAAALLKAEEALEPLDDVAQSRAADAPEWRDHDTVSVSINIGDLRRARATLTEIRKLTGAK